MSKKKILVIHTGGTIAMSQDESSGAVVPVSENPLNPVHDILEQYAHIQVDNYLNLPSPHITPQLMLELAQKIKAELIEYHWDGVVVTHGTDTLEETAYMLDLLLDRDEPVVVTGAMRSSNELSADGPLNLVQSVRVAASEEAKGKGVLVVFNDEIHTAKNVTKTHTSNISTFQSPQYGPIGMTTKHGIYFHHTPIRRDHYEIKRLSKKVILLKAVAGMEADWVEQIADSDADGLVFEAFGQGNLPLSVLPAVEKIIRKGIPVVMVSRCFNGIVEGLYGYKGGGKQLKEMGVIFSNGLNGPKARLKLMVALELTTDREELQDIFLR
ncbi:L-asparaginase [Caldalkalibacillus uzonensis]|uniref:asparaginase n=1 Tax=Caldalkalibacillus uzonensis TaxID=353224 RepID=A0ABU0CMY5_9BACI|nr:asparaginase [Caldalkalibacillus uzonensis]MDQ0337769.1 L-asparaginase [Caldalkalibacillus uzonensis]